jgi:hypothetical protein
MVNDAAPQWPKSETHEQSHHMDCVRMGLWMFCVCHVVIVVSDRVEDPQLIQFLNSVSMLHTMLPREAIHMNMRPRQGGGGGSGSETGLSSTPDTLGMPHVVWAHCGADGAEPHSFAQHQSLLNCSLTFSSFFQQGGGGGDAADRERQQRQQQAGPVKDGAAAAAAAAAAAVATAGGGAAERGKDGVSPKGVTLFQLGSLPCTLVASDLLVQSTQCTGETPLLTTAQQRAADAGRQHHAHVSRDFAHRVLSLPKKISLPVPVQSQHGQGQGGMLRPPSEKEWLRNAVSLFSAIRSFSFLTDYLTVLQSSGSFS